MVKPTKRDFGTLDTERIVQEGMKAFEAAPSDSEKAEVLARIVLEAFDDYYIRSRKIPWLAKQAFETRNWPRAIELSQERIAIFSVSVAKAAPIVSAAIGDNKRLGGFWRWLEGRFEVLVSHRYEADLALAYLASLRRSVLEDVWIPTAFIGKAERTRRQSAKPPGFLQRVSMAGRITPLMVEAILAAPGLEADFQDLPGDSERVAERINQELDVSPERPITLLEVVKAGFYRNRGAYILGALEQGGARRPLALALLHREEGLVVDAVILRETTLRHVFSSTLANFHVTVTQYHELVDYLYHLMPTRPKGMHYSTVGYNHVGKLAVMAQVEEGLKRHGERFSYALGPRGSVAMAFTSPASEYVLKVIRDRPTNQYKWGRYAGRDSVLAKYHSVHEQNRSGSMLDNIIYSNLTLERSLFDERFLDELLAVAGKSVLCHGKELFLNHLIVQRKLVPVPLYLASCSREEAEMVVIRLGQCIRNNAATNVFNKDLDGRNYGVSTLRFVYLFDYDAVEPLTEVKVRSNADREEGEEDIPEWFFEEGHIFLPEEMEAHLRLPDRPLRRLFREAHGELLTLEYWMRMQSLLREGRVPRVRTYPRATQLSTASLEGNLELLL